MRDQGDFVVRVREPLARLLDAAANAITAVAAARACRALQWLDLSDNAISDMDASDIPPAVAFLFLSGNPISTASDRQCVLLYHMSLTHPGRRSSLPYRS